MPSKCKDPFATVYVGLARLNEAMRTQATHVPHLAMVRVRMEEMLAELNELKHQQSQLEASRQQITRRIQELLDQLCKIGNFLEVGLRVHFGTPSEILVAFGMQPFGVPRRGKPAAEEAEAEVESIQCAL